MKKEYWEMFCEMFVGIYVYGKHYYVYGNQCFMYGKRYFVYGQEKKIVLENV